jgi:hypothetical protein
MASADKLDKSGQSAALFCMLRIPHQPLSILCALLFFFRSAGYEGLAYQI